MLDDHDRPLNRRGMRAAPVIGEWLDYRRHHADTVICSTSVRTQETVRRMRAALPKLPEPILERDLYHAAPEWMLERLRALPASCSTVMLVGHQPGLGSLARQLADGTENRRCRRAYEHFPTAAAAVLELEADKWSALHFGSARFTDFAKPRELMDA